MRWIESRVQRKVGQTEWENVNESFALETYFGLTGQTFARLTSGKVPNNPAQQVGPSSALQYQFAGRKLTSYYQGKSVTRVRRFIATFGDGYNSCGLQVISAKSPDSKVSLMGAFDNPSLLFEARSIAIGSRSCSVRNGNVFAQ
jgi:hypothetical protein